MRSHIHRSVSLGIGLGLAALVVSAASAQDLTRYRDYALGSSVSEVVIASGTRATDVRSVHERPASIQELEVRPSYGRSDSRLPDPVRQVEFRFLDDALYQVVVSYDRGRTTGLTDRDVVDAVAAEYGKPTGVNATVGLPADLQRDSVVLAR